MIQSMTGFGSAEHSTSTTSVSVMVRSVNSRHLDLSVRLPEQQLGLEPDIRSLLSEKLSRGRIEVVVTYLTRGDDSVVVRPHTKLFKKLFSVYRNLAPTLSDEQIACEILSRPDVIVVEKQGAPSQKLSGITLVAVHEALEVLIRSRQQEGKLIQRDLTLRISHLQKFYKKVLSRVKVVEKRQKLRSQVQEDREQAQQVRERFDVAEELQRLQSHIGLFSKTIRNEVPGKKLEFILQEMTREVNTLGSKSGDMQLIHTAVEMKAVVEKLKEQVQNVE